MKKNLTLFFLLVGFALGGVAQNQYWNYQSQNYVTNPTSTVSIVHSNGFVYYFQADAFIINANTKLSITEIDPVTMQPTGVDKGSIHLSGLTLEGGFEDENGEFVLYGYKDMGGYQWHPFYMVVGQNFSLNFYWHDITPIGRFVRGCSGYDAYNDPVYVFVMDNGKLFVAEPQSQNANYIATQGLGYPYQDISWDDTHQQFIATGTAPAPSAQYSPGPFVEMLQADLLAASLNSNDVLNATCQYSVHNQTILDGAEFQTLHVQIDDGHLLLYHDLRRDLGDVVWLTLVKEYYNNNHNVVRSSTFEYPAHKLFALDMIYDDINNRLNLLTELMYCDESAMPQQLAQVDPYTLTGMNVIQLDGGYGVNTPCPSEANPNIYVYGTMLDMNRLSFNYHNPCGPVLISGVVNAATSILTETCDVTASACDVPLVVTDNNTNPVIFPYYSQPAAPNPILMTTFSISSYNDYISAGIVCLDPDVCSNQRSNRQEKMMSVENAMKPVVSISGYHHYFCQGFDGEVCVSLYDLTGKRVWMTMAEPDIQNPLPNLHGVYLLQALDNNAHHATCKIVLP